MTSRPWYAFYPKDYQQKTAHLTMLQHGAYRLLLDHYYATAKPLPANAELLHRVCRAFADAERDAIDYILAEFFELGPCGYIQSRVQDELEKAENLSEIRRKAANQRHANAGAIAEQLHTHPHPQSHPQEERKKEGAVNGFVMGGNGSGNGSLSPQDRRSKFHIALAQTFADKKEAWETIAAAEDQSHQDHARAILSLKERCLRLGKRWPYSWQ